MEFQRQSGNKTATDELIAVLSNLDLSEESGRRDSGIALPEPVFKPTTYTKQLNILSINQL